MSPSARRLLFIREVFLSGKTEVGSFCVIEPHCQIVNSRLADHVHLNGEALSNSQKLVNAAIVGPYARLRPESIVGEEAHVGNFVELKKTTLGARSKANHLTYLGDAEIGEDTNIGCGTITCNYAIDRKKYKTKIGDRVFVGSDTQFVAPVTIGSGSAIGSGSTITQDVPEDSLGSVSLPTDHKAKLHEEEGLSMCGIIGYWGPEKPKDIILNGLRRLEYRGYDSAGVAIFDHGSLKVSRSPGKLSVSRKNFRAQIFQALQELDTLVGPLTVSPMRQTPIRIKSDPSPLSTTGLLKITGKSALNLLKKEWCLNLKQIQSSLHIF